MAKWKDTLKGAAKGLPFGLAGAAVGGLAGYLSGKGRDEDPYKEQREKLINTLMERVQGSPFQTESFRQGRSQLYNALSQKRQRDASTAAARGLSGGEFEIAQANQRGRRLSRGMGNLRREAEGMQSQRLYQALSGVQSATNQNNFLLRRNDKRRAALFQGLGNATGGALQAFLGGGG